MLQIVLYVGMVAATMADDPILRLFSKCPTMDSANPTLRLTADVPAYALARCRNGDKELMAIDVVHYSLDGSFSQSYVGTLCQFYKKEGVRTYTVTVEVGWGDRGTQIIQQREAHTISCAYDDHGKAVSQTETIAEWFLNPEETQNLLGGNSSASFTLKVMDALGQEVTSGQLSIGRKVQLVAWDTSGLVNSLRALSCAARNSKTRYNILRAGCGDGLIFPKTAGFETRGNCVYSPWFEAFRLSGGDNTITFECTYTACKTNCDGDSCVVEVDSKPSPPKRFHDDVNVVDTDDVDKSKDAVNALESEDAVNALESEDAVNALESEDAVNALESEDAVNALESDDTADVDGAVNEVDAVNVADEDDSAEPLVATSKSLQLR